MAKDIHSILDGWEFHPGKISVRIVPGDDGRDKIQLRLDLGLLQMEFDGRPDGQRVNKDCESWLEYYQRRQQTHDQRYPDGPPFTLDSEDWRGCSARACSIIIATSASGGSSDMNCVPATRIGI